MSNLTLGSLFDGSGGFPLAAVWRIRGVGEDRKKRTMLLGGFYTLASLGEWVGQLIFNKSVVINYDVGYYDSMSTILLHYPEKLPGYFVLVGVGAVKYILLALVLLSVCLLFDPIIKEHTGSPYELSSEQSLAKSEKIKKDLHTGITVLKILSVAAAAAGIVYRAFRMFSGITFIEYTELAATVVLLIAFLVFLSKLQVGIDNKYYLVKN